MERDNDSIAGGGLSRRAFVGMTAGLVIAGSGLCGRALRATAQAAEDNTLRMAIAVDPDGLDPQRTSAAASFEITNNLYDPLLKVTPEGDLVAGLAESWEVSEDGLAITFYLRPGVTFTNGKACDAEAVLASFARLQDEASPHRAEYADFTFEAVDDTTVKVTSAELNVAALTEFAYAWSAIVDAEQGDSLRNNPVGTGAYKLVSWNPQQSLELEANPDYWGDAPKLAYVELPEIPEATTQASALLSGEIDLVNIENSQAAVFEGNSSIQLLKLPMNTVHLMAMNCANAPLDDIRVRQAIVKAVDKDELIETFWWGFGEKVGSHYPTMLKGYVDCNEDQAYDPEGAKRLLEEAGHADDITLRMRLPKDYQVYVDAGLIIADMLSAVGIACDVEIVEWATWLDDVYTQRDYDLTVVGHTGRLDPLDLLSRYRSDSTSNYFNYKSDEVDQLLDSYGSELDEDRRLDIVARIQHLLGQDAPCLYIQTPTLIYAAASELSGFDLYPIDIYEFKNVALDK